MQLCPHCGRRAKLADVWCRTCDSKLVWYYLNAVVLILAATTVLLFNFLEE